MGKIIFEYFLCYSSIRILYIVYLDNLMVNINISILWGQKDQSD